MKVIEKLKDGRLAVELELGHLLDILEGIEVRLKEAAEVES